MDYFKANGIGNIEIGKIYKNTKRIFLRNKPDGLNDYCKDEIILEKKSKIFIIDILPAKTNNRIKVLVNNKEYINKIGYVSQHIIVFLKEMK